MPLRRRVIQWLAICLILVYWGLGLPFTLLYLNYDPHQLPWILLPYLWEVPTLGFLLVLLPIWRMLDPVTDFLETDPRETIEPERLEKVRSVAMHLPLQVPAVVAVASVMGYAVGSLQMRLFGHLPIRETMKNLVLGVPTGLLYGLLAYFILANLLAPVLDRCARLAGPPRGGPRIPLFWKTWACFFVVSVIAVSVMGLLSYTSSQRLLEQNLTSSMETRLMDLTHAIDQGLPWTSVLEFQGREMVAILDEKGRIIYYRGPDAMQDQLLADAVWIQEDTGNRFLREGEARLLAWRTLRDGSKRVVAEVPFALHANLLARELQGILVAAGVTLTAALLLAIIFARNLSRPVVGLTALATSVPREWPATMGAWHSDDEIGDLGRAFQAMLTELRRGQDDLLEANQLLGQMVKERTRAMQDLSTLLELSQLLSSSLEVDPVLEQLLSKVQGTVGADACSIMVMERHHLVIRAAVGLGLDGPGRPVSASFPPLREALETGRPVTLGAFVEGTPAALLPPGGPLRSVVCVPMVGRDHAVGLLNVYFRESRVLSPEALALLRSIGSQAGVAVGKARLFQEKNRVTELLRSVLRPQPDLGFPGLDVGSVYIPSRDLSGDYFDLIALSERRVAVIMADVAGKGSEAAIEAVRIKHTLQTYAIAGYSPAALVRLLNEQLHRTAEDMPRMVTLFYGELDLEAGTLTFASAGHEPPILWIEPEGEPRFLYSDGIVLGAIAEAEYSQSVVRLDRGAGIALYTDGITEARSPEGELFGPERLLEILKGSEGLSARAIAERVNQAVHDFSEGELTDDLSLLILKCVDVRPRPVVGHDGDGTLSLDDARERAGRKD